MALMDVLEIIDPEQFVEWKQSVEARILTEDEIETNVCKMDQLDEVLVSKIQEEYHRLRPSKWVATTLGTMAQLLFAPNHVDRYVLTNKR
jgi:hypothetical protein